MKRGLFDLSSIVWTCLKAGEDKEQGIKIFNEDGTPKLRPNGKQVIVNSADYGYANAINHITSVMKELDLQPYQMILVKEGKNSKIGRQSIYEGYKGTRDKLPQEYEEFQKCRDELIRNFLDLGAQVVTQDGVEADDVLGYLAKALKGEVWIVTNDKDLAQCIGGNVHLYRRGERDTNPFGPFDVRYIPVAIALLGDVSDEIPGAKGFGEKSLEKLLINFGDEGLEMMEGLIKTKSLGRLAEDVGEMKELQKIIDSASSVYTSYELARLRIEKVNTLQKPLVWTVGKVVPRDQYADASLRKYAGVTRLVCAENYDEALDFFKRHLKASPFVSLDIETSTPPESDEWLAAQDKEDTTVDTFGSELTGLSVTFGPNLQYTLYLTVDHVEEEGVTNLTKEQAKEFIQAIPRSLVVWVHNFSFESCVLFNSLGDFREQVRLAA